MKIRLGISYADFRFGYDIQKKIVEISFFFFLKQSVKNEIGVMKEGPIKILGKGLLEIRSNFAQD